MRANTTDKRFSVSGYNLTIALNRIPAGSDEKKGSLLFNPGGPGGSGTELLYIAAEEDLVPAAVAEVYDQIGFDPRGVNESTPVDCREFFYEEINDYPLDFTQLQEYQADTSNCFRPV